MTIQELEQFIEQYGKSTYSFCMKLCLNKDEADELYQDTWLNAMQGLSRIKSDDNVRSYLLGIVLRIWKNKKKRFAVRNRIAPFVPISEEMENIPEAEEDSLSEILNCERKQVVLEAIASLEDIYRIPILLFYMEEQTVKEIAKELHIPEGTVKRRLWSARNKLSIKLEAYINE